MYKHVALSSFPLK